MKKVQLIIAVILFLNTGTSFMKPEDFKSNLHHIRTGSFATIEPGVARSHLLSEFRICKTDITVDSIKKYVNGLAKKIGLKLAAIETPVVVVDKGIQSDNVCDIEAALFGENGSMQVYYWRKPRLLVINILGINTDFNQDKISDVTKEHFGLIEYTELALSPDNVKRENSKVEVRSDHELGKGLFAKEDIAKGEFIGGLYGLFYEADSSMALPEDVRDHLMQCGDKFYRGNEFADEAVQYLNHSCDPNCGVQGLFDFVAMRDIKAGEEITTDYAMQDDSNWEVPGGGCLCGSKGCRNDILPYRDLTQTEKDTYKNYVSHWLLHKYKTCSCKK